MRKGNKRLVLLECGCTVRLIQETTMKDKTHVMMLSGHLIVVTKLMIQILEKIL